MKKELYKDKDYKLFVEDNKVYIIIRNTKFEIQNPFISPCMGYDTWNFDIIQGNDKYTKTKGFDLNILKNCDNDIIDTGEFRFGNISLFDFCKMIDQEVLKEKSKRKQEIVKKTGYKTSKRN